MPSTDGAASVPLVPIEDRPSDRLALASNELLIELSVALHRYSMYPKGHPSLAPAVGAVLARAEKLLVDQSTIVIGVAKRQLIVEGAATDPNHPVLRRLAESLHRHHIGTVTIAPGVEPSELDEALRSLAAEAERDGPIGLKSDAQTSWPHLTLHPMTFDGLAIVDASAAALPVTDVPEAEIDLWVGLARAAMAIDECGDQSGDLSPAAVARAINDHPRGEAYDKAIVGYLFQILQELKTATGKQGEELRRRTSDLLSSLQPDTLQALMHMGGDAARRRRFVLDVSRSMAVDAVIEIVKAAAGASGETISHGLVRMLSKLSMHTGPGTEGGLTGADLRDQIARLLEDWNLEDPNPEAYGRVLQHLATSSHRRTGLAAQVTQAPEPLRLVQMSLESGVAGPLVEKALDALVTAGESRAITALLSNPPNAGAEVTDSLLTWLVRPAALKALIEREPLDVASLDALLPRMSLEGYEYLLGVLAASENRTTRRRLVDRLSRTEMNIGPLVLKHLDDPRWYVQRNMLILLDRFAVLPEGFSPAAWATHQDPRVRCEAIRLQLKLPEERWAAVVRALDDPDPRIVHLGLSAMQEWCPLALLPVVLNLTVDADLDDDIRALAVRVAGRVPQREVLETLLELTDGGRSLLGRFRLPVKTPVVVAALRALAETWSSDLRARAVLAVAADASDPDLRAAALLSAS